MKIPDTLAATLDAAVLGVLEEKLAPPPELRAKARVEFEIEAAGEGTFTIVVDGGKLSAKKGFAKAPLVAAAIPRGGWALLQRELQAVVDGLPAAPQLKAELDKLRAPKPGDLDVVVAAVQKIDDARVDFDIKGAGASGKYSVARGPVDEATRVLAVSLDAAAIDAVLAGASPTTLKASVGGDRGLLTAVLAALAPVVRLVR